MMKELESAAKELAWLYGRDWSDMGAYERQDYIDEAQRSAECDEMPGDIMAGAFTPFARNH